MNIGLRYFVGLAAAALFVSIHAVLVQTKGLATGLKYGVLFGLGTGISMGYGRYCVMPIFHHLALICFVGTTVETAVGGLLVESIAKDSKVPDTNLQ